MARSKEMTLLEARIDYTEYPYRTPIKFGGRVGTASTVATVEVKAALPHGKPVTGTGSMTLGLGWSWPSDALENAEKARVFKALAQSVCRRLPDLEPGDPIQLGAQLETLGFAEAQRIGTELGLPEPIPRLAVLVVISPIDAAIHDAYGRAHGRSVWSCYTHEFLNHDLSHELGPQYRGEYPQQYVLTTPQPSLPLYHLVGGLDPLTPADILEPVGGEHPESLDEWITRDGLTHLKIKLNGDDLEWDLDRVLAVDAVAHATAPETAWHFSLDFNEKCPNTAYLMEFLHRLKGSSNRAFERVQYIEQPTSRDLVNHGFDVHEAAALKPIVVDEALDSIESVTRAYELGYSGVALKACKGQTQSLLAAAVARRMGLFLCVQDLTCPGRAFAWSASIASHIRGVAAIEGNARQYMPQASAEWAERMPELFRVKDGRIGTSALKGVGLGY